LLVLDILLRGLIFILPGLALCLIVHRRRALEPLSFAAVTLVNSAAVAYVVFWPYLVSARFGKALSAIVGFGALAVIIREFLSRRIEIRRLRELGICALLMVLVSVAYSSIGNMYHYSNDPVIQAQQRFIDLPPDNFIPYVFAARLYHSVPVRPWLFGEWKSSDRPPLAAGATLFQIPLWKSERREFHYQNLSVFLQSMWIAALWIVLYSAQVPRRIIAVTCAFCVLSPTFLLFTFFVWPKFLAAAPMYLRNRGPDLVLSGALRRLTLSVFSLVVWCLMMFLPGSTLLHEGSLATVILLFVALAAMLAMVIPRVSYVLLAIQAVLLFPLYVVARPFLAGGVAAVWHGVDRTMAIVAFSSLSALALLGWRFGFHQHAGQTKRAATSHAT